MKHPHLCNQQPSQEVGQAAELGPAEQDIQVKADRVRLKQRILAILDDILPEVQVLHLVSDQLQDLGSIVDLLCRKNKPEHQQTAGMQNAHQHCCMQNSKQQPWPCAALRSCNTVVHMEHCIQLLVGMKGTPQSAFILIAASLHP